jgi:hypothetical protein
MLPDISSVRQRITTWTRNHTCIVYVHASFQQSTNMTMQASVMENMPVGTYVGIAKVWLKISIDWNCHVLLYLLYIVYSYAIIKYY